MRYIRVAAALVVAVASLVDGQNLRQNRDKVARQYYGYNSNNNNGYNSASSNQVLQQSASPAPTASNNGYSNSIDYNNYQQQYGYYDGYGSASDYAQDYASAATFGSGVAAENPDSSPALSALALLGFLYFLNLIQDVLQNNNGRRRRSLTPLQESLGEELLKPLESLEEEQLKSLGSQEPLEEEQLKPLESTDSLEEEQLKTLESLETLEEEQLKPLESTDSLEEEQLKPLESLETLEDEPENEEPSEEGASDRKQSGRRLSFFEDFFIRLPQALGLVKKQNKGGPDFLFQRRIDRNGRDEAAMTVGGFLTSRLKMISSIMNFLRDPSPSRVRRSLPNSSPPEADMGGNGEQQVPLRAARSRRFTHGMNAWYGDLSGRNAVSQKGAGGMAAKIVSLLGGGRDLQAVASADAVPALLEATRTLAGDAHPHCLQRVLCRISTHQPKLSLMPRLALQFLSNKLAEGAEDPQEHLQAVAAGRRGEDCEKSFPHCSDEFELKGL